MKQFAVQNKLTLFHLFSALYILFLNRLSNHSVISIGVLYSNRYRPELESMCGFFVNNYL